MTFETWLGTFLFITIGSGQLSFPSLEIDSVGTQPVSTLYKVADMPYTSVHVPCHSAEEYCSGAEYPGYISQAISVPVVLPALIWILPRRLIGYQLGVRVHHGVYYAQIVGAYG